MTPPDGTDSAGNQIPHACRCAVCGLDFDAERDELRARVAAMGVDLAEAGMHEQFALDEALEALKLCVAVCAGFAMSKKELVEALGKAQAVLAKHKKK